MSRSKDRRTALNRIDILFEEAKKAVQRREIERAHRYVDLARKIGMRHNVPLPSKYKRRVCENCHSYLYPGKTCKTRLRKGQLVSSCLECGTINRYGYEKEKEK